MRTHIRHLALPIVAFGFLTSCAYAQQTRGSGVATTDNRTTGAFDRVVIAGSANVEIAVGSALSVQVSGDDNVVPLIETVVQDGALRVGPKRGSNYSARLPIKVTVTVPALRGASISGSGSITVTGVDGGKLDFTINGSGNVVARGSADALNVSINGSGAVKARELRVREADVSIAGAGDVVVDATERLGVSIAGAGSVSYLGRPTISQQRIMGAGSVRAIN